MVLAFLKLDIRSWVYKQTSAYFSLQPRNCSKLTLRYFCSNHLWFNFAKMHLNLYPFLVLIILYFSLQNYPQKYMSTNTWLYRFTHINTNIKEPLNFKTKFYFLYIFFGSLPQDIKPRSMWTMLSVGI